MQLRSRHLRSVLVVLRHYRYRPMVIIQLIVISLFAISHIHANGLATRLVVFQLPQNSTTGPHAVLGSNLLFYAATPESGIELWRSDGTISGTVLLKDIAPGSIHSRPVLFTQSNGFVFFSADDGQHGRELWRTDGTPEGTIMLGDLAPGSTSSEPQELISSHGKLFFLATVPNSGTQLWTSDGTPSGTQMLTSPSLLGAGHPSELRATTDHVFFFSNYDLWQTDGTLASTQVRIPFAAPGAELPTVSGAHLFFLTSEISNTKIIDHLWSTDGTANGSGMIKTFPPATLGIVNLIDVQGHLFFFANRTTDTMELWQTDGTSGGTQPIATVCQKVGIPYTALGTEVNGNLFFMCGEPTLFYTGYQLWRSDGTAEGTHAVTTFYRDPARSTVFWLMNARGRLLLNLDDGVSGNELWRSDGTESGTQLVEDIAPGSTGSDPSNAIVMENTLFFDADDGSTGVSLWSLPMTALGAPVTSPLIPPSQKAHVYLPILQQNP